MSSTREDDIHPSRGETLGESTVTVVDAPDEATACTPVAVPGLLGRLLRLVRRIARFLYALLTET